MVTDRVKIERPVAAFITFETQEGYERGLQYFGMKAVATKEELAARQQYVPVQDTDLLLHKFEMGAAPEPSNIKWENRHVTRSQQMCKSIIINFLVLCHLVAALALFAYMMQFAVTNLRKYPPTTDCASVDS